MGVDLTLKVDVLLNSTAESKLELDEPPQANIQYHKHDFGYMV
jgi:hypothetical protein